MPLMDGLKFAFSMKHSPLLKRLKLLLTTSRLNQVSSSELAAAGKLVALLRPYTLGRLRSRIQEVMTQIRKASAGAQDEVDLHLNED